MDERVPPQDVAYRARQFIKGKEDAGNDEQRSADNAPDLAPGRKELEHDRIHGPNAETKHQSRGP